MVVIKMRKCITQLYKLFCGFAYVFMKAILVSTMIIAMAHVVLLLLSLLFSQAFHDSIILFEKPWCHQIASRSFCFRGMQLPLCARCCGIMVGLPLSPLMSSKLPRSVYFYLAIVFVSFFDIILKRFGIDSSNTWRFFAGIGMGFLFFIFVERIVKSLMLNFNNLLLAHQSRK